jgi:selenocysteine-specific translation elongation factor
MKRSAKETAKVVEKTIKEITKVLEAVPVMKGYNFFNIEKFEGKGFDKLVKDLCENNEISESHIRRVAGL